MGRSRVADRERLFSLMQQYKDRKEALRTLLLTKSKLRKEDILHMGLPTLEKRCQDLGLLPKREERGQKQALGALFRRPGGDDAA